MAAGPTRQKLHSIMVVLIYCIVALVVVFALPRIVNATGLPPVVVVAALVAAFLAVAVASLVRSKNRNKGG